MEEKIQIHVCFNVQKLQPEEEMCWSNFTKRISTNTSVINTADVSTDTCITETTAANAANAANAAVWASILIFYSGKVQKH